MDRASFIWLGLRTAIAVWFVDPFDLCEEIWGINVLYEYDAVHVDSKLTAICTDIDEREWEVLTGISDLYFKEESWRPEL